MGVSRRNFLKMGGLTLAGTALLGLAEPANADIKKGLPGIKSAALLNDTSKCIGCLSCTIACKKANNLPEPYQYTPGTGGDAWTTVRFAENKGKPVINLKIQCMHCTEASCVSVCPTGAAFKRDDGVVLIDQKTCIGCKYCVMACPFNVPGASEVTGTARKCTFCEKRLAEGKITACAEACPTGAIEFGNSVDLYTKARERVEELKANNLPNAVLYGKQQLGGLKVLYVLPESPEICGLPAKPRVATGDSLMKWAVGLVTAGLLAGAPLRKLFKDDNDTVDVPAQKGVSKDV